jgi:hypothetical protein
MTAASARRIDDATDVSSSSNSDSAGEVTISYDPSTDACPAPAAVQPVVIQPTFTG